MALDVARSWLGFASRWLGPARTSITGVSEVALPVVVVGHDACDGGGMTGASVFTTLAVGTFVRMRLSSQRGFALWSVRARVAASAADRLFSLRTLDPPALAGAPLAVRSWSDLRDVAVSATVEAAPAPVSAFSVPLLGGGAVDEFQLPGRPMVIAPRETLDLWINATAGDAHYSLLFEEGL